MEARSRIGLSSQGEANQQIPRTHTFFFYGTLLDADLRRALCGPAADGWDLVPAELPGHRRGRSPGRTYPYLLPAPESRVPGLVADGLSPEAAAILTLYEGRGYRVAAVVPDTSAGPRPCWVFLPRRTVVAPLPWTLEGWREAHKAAALKRLRAWRSGVSDGDIARAAAPWRERPPWPEGEWPCGPRQSMRAKVD
ncbi:hypothetical protein STAQ_33220 [Allostella sp. ATCC 35155]|nr:hypothetical protein STAQ_33220 [Stella sp. ATCC 35155]